MRPDVPEAAKHKRGATLRIERRFPDRPEAWTFSAAILLPDGTRVPLTCTPADPDAYTMGEVPDAGYGLVYLSLPADQTLDLPLGLLPCDYRAVAGSEVAVSETFYIRIFPEVT